MKLEDQVCSLELSKRLQELGVEQNSNFTWLTSIHYKDGKMFATLPFNFYAGVHVDDTDRKAYSAFTVTELGELLPEIVKGYWLHIIKDDSWNATYRDSMSTMPEIKNNYISKYFSDENLANALAKLLIFLIENKMVEL